MDDRPSRGAVGSQTEGERLPGAPAGDVDIVTGGAPSRRLDDRFRAVHGAGLSLASWTLRIARKCGRRVSWKREGRSFTPEFKAEAVKVVQQSGKSVAMVA